MKTILNRLINQETLSKDEAYQILVNISKGQYNPYQITAFLTIYMTRSITVNELGGFRQALLDLCLPIDLSDFNTIDLCGTGGDGKDTFNISTLTSFVVAGAGIRVAKHGNYGVSSSCGSSNVLEYLGVKFTNEQSKLQQAIDKAGICVLHAPLFHPAMKEVAPIRKALGVKTFFNMLGPMVNPSFPQNQMVGVFNLELARKYAYFFQDSDKNYVVLHDLAGYDELSLTDTSKVMSRSEERMLSAADFGINPLQQTDIYGGQTVAESAAIFTNVLENKSTEAQKNVVCANAALAISLVKNCSLEDGFETAKTSVESQAALKSFKKLIDILK
jgi:anthranilate phosphoribosyltransferase